MKRRKLSSGCLTCAKPDSSAENARLKQALNRLERKQVELANLVAEYMNEAALDRPTRTRLASEKAAAMIRIVGGRMVLPGSYPECCLIGQSHRNGTKTWHCTGTLIAPRVVLTAAHCWDPPDYKVNVVALGAENMANLSQAEIVGVRRMVVHPDYARSDHHDVAVLILRREAKTKPVPLASEAALKAARRVTLVGFGNNDLKSSRGFGIKREVNVRITHLRRKETDDFDDAEEELGFESDLEFVAGGDGFDSCNGDSGGPAYIGEGAKRLLAGVTSRPLDTFDEEQPCGDGGIYARSDAHRAFIQRVAKEAGVTLGR